MIRFFLHRPIFATVCSLMITLAGAIVIPTLPIAQYPQVSPPVVTVTATWTGASPTAIESAVTVPLENALNDVEGLRYITSSSADGVSTVTCTFSLGTNLDIAAADVQNAVQSSLGLLPPQVTQTGVTIAKNSGSILVALALESHTSKYDDLWLSNYAQLNVVNSLARVSGVSQVRIFGQRRYAMRIWLDPRKLAQEGLTVPNVINALSEQNEEVAAGSIGSAPEPSGQPYTYVVNATGRLSDPSQFSNIILRSDPNGGFTRLGDVARIELGAEDYSSYIRFDGERNVVGIGIFQYPDANALSVASAVTDRMKTLAASFPAGITYTIALDSTTYVRESVREVLITLLLSVLLVVLVIYLFLQDPRATLIPAATIPVSLIGTFFVMKVFGFTINTITLFGLTLATGLVVDDAIVVIENIARHMQMGRGGVAPSVSARNGANDGGARRTSGWRLALARVATGALWLAAGISAFTNPSTYASVRAIAASAVARASIPATGPLHAFVAGALQSNVDLVAQVVRLAAIVVGFLLVVGLWSRLAGLLGSLVGALVVLAALQSSDALTVAFGAVAFVLSLANVLLPTARAFGLDALRAGSHRTLPYEEPSPAAQSGNGGGHDRPATPFESALRAMHEIQSAIVASSLVLLAVFVPVAFFPGTTGLIYRQFALTIAASITISLFAALTLAPTLTARLLHGEFESNAFVFHYFNLGYHAFRDWYARNLPRIARATGITLAIFAAALVATGILFRTTPTAFIPNEDQGFAIILVQAPEGTSLSYESDLAAKVERILLASPDVSHVFNVGGFSFSGSAPNYGLVFVRLKPWAERPGSTHSLDYLLGEWNAQFSQIPGGTIVGFDPPAINGIGSFGGFQFELEDQGSVGLPVLAQTANAIVAAAYQDPRLAQVFTTFRLNSPQIQLDIDRNKVKALGISMNDLFETVGTDLGSYYVNDFDYLNRSWRVYVQADTPYRDRIDALQSLYVAPAVPPSQGPATSTGLGSGQTPVSALVSVAQVKTAPVIAHYDLFRSLEINGSSAPGHGSGEAIAAMEQIFARVAPAGIGYEWSGLQLDEIAAGSTSTFIFLLGLIVVFLVLSAQYESFVDPLIVILAVPAAIFGALVALNVRHLPQDIYAQVGFVMLIGLASKSAILIVEFANQQMRLGIDEVTAALRAAQTRLRPIMMTSIAFVIAVLPMVFATGAGSAARHSLGTVVFGGMLVSTFLNLAITPVLYIVVKRLVGRRAGRRGTAEAPLREGVPTGHL